MSSQDKKPELTLNEIMVDYVTVTSFDERNKRRWETVMSGAFVIEGYDQKRRNYTGTAYKGGFVGQRMQAGRVHTMAFSSGKHSNDIFYRLVRSCAGEHKYTRLDIQLTVELPEFHSARNLADHLRVSQTRKVLLYESNNGLDTVYVGSRESQKYWRIYVKETSEGRFLRFEIEIKHGRDDLTGRIVVSSKRNGKWSLVSYFFEDIDRLSLPDAYMAIIKPFRTAKTAPLPVNVIDEGNTFKWLNGVVRKTIVSYALESHGRAEFVINWLMDIAGQIGKGM